jgi:regulator of nucleoside diphosphate kinase
MNHTSIYITRSDAEILRELLREAEQSGGYRGSAYLRDLRVELERAEVIPDQDAPPDLITLNASAQLRNLDTGETMEVTLVRPGQADLFQQKVSILAPIGAAMLGYRTGSIFTWDTPRGTCRLRVEQVIPPPAV